MYIDLTLGFLLNYIISPALNLAINQSAYTMIDCLLLSVFMETGFDPSLLPFFFQYNYIHINISYICILKIFWV